MEMLGFAFTTFTDKNISVHLTHMSRERKRETPLIKQQSHCQRPYEDNNKSSSCLDRHAGRLIL